MDGANGEERMEKRARWEERIAAWEAGGLSQAAFCRENGLALHRFLYWRRKCRQAPEVVFAEVDIPNRVRESGIDIPKGSGEVGNSGVSVKGDTGISEGLGSGEAKGSEGACGPGCCVVVRVGGRFSVEVRSGFSSEVLGRVVRVLEAL